MCTKFIFPHFKGWKSLTLEVGQVEQISSRTNQFTAHTSDPSWSHWDIKNSASGLGEDQKKWKKCSAPNPWHSFRNTFLVSLSSDFMFYWIHCVNYSSLKKSEQALIDDVCGTSLGFTLRSTCARDACFQNGKKERKTGLCNPDGDLMVAMTIFYIQSMAILVGGEKDDWALRRWGGNWAAQGENICFHWVSSSPRRKRTNWRMTVTYRF